MAFRRVSWAFLLTPVSALAFWTLPQKYRTEGSGMFELSRNLGSSIGVSIRTGMPARYVQMNRCRTHHTVQRCDAESVDLELPESAYAPWVIDALDATVMRTYRHAPAARTPLARDSGAPHHTTDILVLRRVTSIPRAELLRLASVRRPPSAATPTSALEIDTRCSRALYPIIDTILVPRCHRASS